MNPLVELAEVRTQAELNAWCAKYESHEDARLLYGLAKMKEEMLGGDE